MAEAIGFKWSENTEPKFLCETAKIYQLGWAFILLRELFPLLR
jgi:hypothetical protein